MKERQRINNVIKRLSTYNEEIDLQNPSLLSEDLKYYLQYYKLPFQTVNYHFGVVSINNSKVMVQVYNVENCRGTVFLLHGYFDHVGHLKHIISFLIKHNYRVITYDLKGHGLSDGAAAVVHSFEEYVETLEAMINKMKARFLGPYTIIAHSTGAAITIDYLLRNQQHDISKVILVSPLVRSHLWLPTKFSYYILNPFIEEIKRKYRRNSSNEVHRTFVREDPLQYDGISLKWIRALIEWNSKIQAYSSSNMQLFIIQGEKDQTVDWRYNIQFIAKKFPDTILSLLKEGRHQLFNEQKDLRLEVFHLIHMYLTKEFK